MCAEAEPFAGAKDTLICLRLLGRPLPHKDPTSIYRHGHLICLIWSSWIHLSCNTDRRVPLISQFATAALLVCVCTFLSQTMAPSSSPEYFKQKRRRKEEKKRSCCFVFFSPRCVKDLIKPKKLTPNPVPAMKRHFWRISSRKCLFLLLCVYRPVSHFRLPLTLALFERERVAPALLEPNADNFGKLQR